MRTPIERVKSAQSFSALFRSVQALDDYHSLALAYGLGQVVIDDYAYLRLEHLSHYAALVRELNAVLYDSDFSDEKLHRIAMTLQLIPEDPTDPLESALAWALGYAIGVNTQGKYFTRSPSFERLPIEKKDYVKIDRVHQEIANAYAWVKLEIPSWKDKDHLRAIKTDVLSAVGWRPMEQFPWRA